MNTPSASRCLLFERIRAALLCVVSTLVCWTVLMMAGGYAQLVHQVRAVEGEGESCSRPVFRDTLLEITHDAEFALRGLLLGLAAMLGAAGLLALRRVLHDTRAPFRRLFKLQMMATGLALAGVLVFTEILLSYHRTPRIEPVHVVLPGQVLGFDGPGLVAGGIALSGCLTVLIRTPGQRWVAGSTTLLSLAILALLRPLQGILSHAYNCMVGSGDYRLLWQVLSVPCLLGPLAAWGFVEWRSRRGATGPA